MSSPDQRSLPARYYHLPVMSECDAECRLCATLGCLRPARVTSPEFRRELDLAQRNLKTAIVFPPNFLHHPEASQFVAEVTARGLQAIVRLRPEQLFLFSELIATLEYRSAKFEVIVSEPLPEKALRRRAGRPLPAFKTVLIPTRAFDPTLLLDSLPLSWRRDLEVLAALPSLQSSALSADELYLWMKASRLKPYVEFDRRPFGYVPGAAAATEALRFSFRAIGANEMSIALSVVVAVSGDARIDDLLASLKPQTFPRQKFEVIFALDRVNEEAVEALATWARQSDLTVCALELAKCWGHPPTRVSEAWNLAASHARGSMLLFLSSGGGSIAQDHFAIYARELGAHSLVVTPKIENGFLMPEPASFGVTLRHYFNVGAFAEAIQTTSFEAEFLLWKSRQMGVEPFLLAATELDAAAKVPVKRVVARKQARSAQEFYFCTLSADVFENHFALMGAHFQLRRAMATVSRWSFVRRSRNALISFAAALDRARFTDSIRQIGKVTS